jgi:hypothetical protein
VRKNTALVKRPKRSTTTTKKTKTRTRTTTRTTKTTTRKRKRTKAPGTISRTRLILQTLPRVHVQNTPLPLTVPSPTTVLLTTSHILLL